MSSMKKIGRRDFLKLIATLPTGLALSNLISFLDTSANNSSSPHIIVIVLDTLTARNMSLYGYSRKTTPNIERFASRSNVYHSHYSAGTYTTPGTASLLTGTYPWTHRAINLQGIIARDKYKRNLFHLLESHYNRIAYTQNHIANYLLSQLIEDFDRYLPIHSFSKLGLFAFDSDQRDHLNKFRAFNNFLFTSSEGGTPGALISGLLNKYRKEISFQKVIMSDLQSYNLDLIFDIDDVFSGLSSEVLELKMPSFCYFHLYPPHEPYVPKKKFRNLFNDGWRPISKPVHPLFSVDRKIPSHSKNTLIGERLKYDQFIATVDAAFGKFLDTIEEAGILENSYIMLTSDHGESFERGYWKHSGPFVYEPGIHIPLIISTPGQTVRRDFYSVTNSVDLLPTLLNNSNFEIPAWAEGKLLPGFGGEPDNSRLTFSMDAKEASAFGDLSPITIAMYQGDYKIIYYKGYGEKDSPYNEGLFELYNIKIDPEELQDLNIDEPVVAKKMQELLLEAYNKANQPLS